MAGAQASRRSRRLKIMHVIEDLDSGGAERLLIRIVSNLLKEPFQPSVCCLTKKGRLATELESRGVPVFVMHKRPGFDPALVFRLAWLMRRRGIDLAHAHVFTANMWTRLAARLASIPGVITHEHSSFTVDSPRRRRIEQALAPWSSCQIAVSRELQARFETLAFRHQRRLTIHNGLQLPQNGAAEKAGTAIDLSRFGAVIGTVGRLEPRKNHRLLLQAFARVRRQRGDAGLLIVGAGPEEATLRSQADALALDGSVVFAGYRADVAGMLSQMQVFCLSSDTEGISMALLEAMAAGVPVVATAVGGNPEVIADPSVGVLVPPGDADSLATALLRVLNERQHAQEMAVKAREFVQTHFSESRMMRELETLYLELWQQKAGSRYGTDRAHVPQYQPE